MQTAQARQRRRAGLGILVVVLLVGLVGLAPVDVAAVTLPSGFTDTKFATGFGDRVTMMAFSPDGRLFVSEKRGQVRIVKNGNLLSRPFLTLNTFTEGERGLKGIAFDPNYASNRFFYVYYTDPDTITNRVSRFRTRADNPDVADPSSEVILVKGIVAGIFHSAGALHFGRDGKLYVSTGDGARGRMAQELDNLDGKILRLNTDGSAPSDNPFVDRSGARPEIWAYGLRNPYSVAFDPGSSRMFINDVGLTTAEEINEGRRGGNYGWPTCEGPCGDPRFIDPIYSYPYGQPGKAITGAVFYRGGMFPSDYQGDFFFGDYVGEYIKRYDVSTRRVMDFASSTPGPVDLDIGPDGALYYLSVNSRIVHRIAYNGGGGPTPTRTPTPTPSRTPTPPPSEGEAPVARIALPASGDRFRAGDRIEFSGSATDAEDGRLSSNRLTWEVVFHHDVHTHPFIDPFSGQSSGTFVVPDTGETAANVWYRIHLTARDTDGNTHHVTRDIRPVVSTVTLVTRPAGLTLELDGSPFSTAHTFDGVVGMQRELSAPATQTRNGTTYRFVSWSDGGTRTHMVATPGSDTTYTATYEVVDGGGPTVREVFRSGFERAGSNWLAPWSLKVRDPARASIVRDTFTSGAGDASARIRISGVWTDWHVQLLRPNVPLVAGVRYTISFRARASQERRLRIAFQQNSVGHPKYFDHEVAIGTTWRRYDVSFTAPTTDSRSLFNFNLAEWPGTVWIDSVSLTR